MPDAPLFQILQLREQAIKELVGVDGVKRLYAFTTLSGKPQTGQMYVVVGIPKEIAFAEVDQRTATEPRLARGGLLVGPRNGLVYRQSARGCLCYPARKG